MTHYHVLSPCSGKWLRAPFDGASFDRSKAHLYPANHPHLDSMVRMARRYGYKLRLRQVMVVEEDA